MIYLFFHKQLRHMMLVKVPGVAVRCLNPPATVATGEKKELSAEINPTTGIHFWLLFSLSRFTHMQLKTTKYIHRNMSDSNRYEAIAKYYQKVLATSKLHKQKTSWVVPTMADVDWTNSYCRHLKSLELTWSNLKWWPQVVLCCTFRWLYAAHWNK